MNRKLIIFLSFISILGILSSCEKDGTQIVMKANPTAPQLVTIPDLTLKRANGTDTLEFVGTPVDPGFTASATYFLEACASGNNFEKTLIIYSGPQDLSMKITVGDLNQALLNDLKLQEDATSSIDIRLRAVLNVDAGTGAPGTGNNPFEYSSDIATKDATIFGLLRLDLNNSGLTQKIVSPLGDGKYSGLVKLDPAQPFTLTDPETGKTYGGSGGTLAVDGAGIVVNDKGWYDLSADINALTYNPDPYMIGIIGSATPTGWDSDTDMDYDPKTGRWFITIDLIGGQYIKFRKNDSWSWNMGLADDETGGLTGNLKQGGVGNDIPIPEDGNYTVYFTIINDNEGTYEIVKNSK